MRNLVLAATLAITTTLPAFAEESCQLKRLAVIPFQTDRTAHVYVPVTLNGRMTHLMLDTGAFWSGLNNGLVKALNLTPQTSTFVYMYDLAGEKIDKMVTVSEMKIGEVPFTEPVDFFVHGEAGGSIEEDGGVLGRNLFTQMDVEIDNAGKTISLFTQDHCKGAGVYWADEAVTLTFKKQTTPPPVGTHLRQKTPKNQIDTPIVGADLEAQSTGDRRSARYSGCGRYGSK